MPPLHPRVADRRPWLIAEDWQSRALLLAELATRGVAMRAEAGVKWALHAAQQERLAPPLILLVTHQDSMATPGRVARLLTMVQGDGNAAPQLLLLIGTFERGLWESFARRATLLLRPQTVGDIARDVSRALAHIPDEP